MNTATAKRVAAHPAHRERVRRHLHRDGSRPGVALRRQVGLQLGRLGRGARPGERARAPTADQPCASKIAAEQVGGGGLAARAGDADDRERLGGVAPEGVGDRAHGVAHRRGRAAAAAASATGRSTRRAAAPAARGLVGEVVAVDRARRARSRTARRASTGARVVHDGGDLDVPALRPARGSRRRRASRRAERRAARRQPPSSSAVVDVVPGRPGAVVVVARRWPAPAPARGRRRSRPPRPRPRPCPGRAPARRGAAGCGTGAGRTGRGRRTPGRRRCRRRCRRRARRSPR